MAFKWFTKDKEKTNKQDHNSDDVQDSSLKMDEEQSPVSEIQGTDPGPTATEEPAADTAPSREKAGYFKRLKNRLSRSRKTLSGSFDKIFAGAKKIDDEMLEELEELLITSDIGVQTTMELIEGIARAKFSDPGEVKQKLKEEILSILGSQPAALKDIKSTPHVILVVGVNGVGKTTTIGKIASSLNIS